MQRAPSRVPIVRPLQRDLCQRAQLGDGRAELVSDVGAEAALAREGGFEARKQIVEAPANRQQLAGHPVRGKPQLQRRGVDPGGVNGETGQRLKPAVHHDGGEGRSRGRRRRANKQQGCREPIQSIIEIRAVAGDDERDLVPGPA